MHCLEAQGKMKKSRCSQEKRGPQTKLEKVGALSAPRVLSSKLLPQVQEEGR